MSIKQQAICLLIFVVGLHLTSSFYGKCCKNLLKTVSRTVNNTKVFSYTNNTLVNGRGIDVDCDANFDICAYSSGNIHQITKVGKLIRIIPELSKLFDLQVILK